MTWLKIRRYRVIASYPFAVWSYGLIFAAISGVYPTTAMEWAQFVFMPVSLTLQLPFLFMKGSGWLFVIVCGLLWAAICDTLKIVAWRK